VDNQEDRDPEEISDYSSEIVDEIVQNEPQIARIVTPVDDWTYWTKWIGNAFLIIGTMLTNLEMPPFNFAFTTIGLTMWAIVAAQWNDRSLVVLNVFLLGTVSMSLARYIKELL
jgi:hypothetical protein